ncbi:MULTISPECIES: SRPBCC domain-containing protein [unclassified Geodermatophilus]
MELTQTFAVPVPIETAWKALNDPERIAPCMPGASLESVDGDSFTGNVKIKLGPIGLSYRGTARFVDVDPETRTVVIEGSGKDAKGNGSASATVTARLTEDAGTTTVATTTDVNITGKPAQFGRGVMNDVANKIVAQFAGNLATLLTSDEGAPAAAPSTPTQAAAATSPVPVAARPAVTAPAAAELDAFALLGISPTVRRRLAAALVLADVFVLGWAIGRLGNRR